MNRKSSTSIQRQLQLFFVATLGLTVLIMGGVWIGYNQVLLEEEAERVLIVESDIIGTAVRPAMMFNDKRMAEDLLKAMKFDPDVAVVKLFTFDGQTLFSYVAEDDTATHARMIEFRASQSTSYANGRLHLYRIVEHKGEPVGVIYLESRLNHLREGQYAGVVTVVAVMVGCLLLGLIMASRLQKKIAQPISSLAALMRQMGRERDYSLRQENRTYNRETEELVVGFNQMADEIQSNFRTIEENHQHLLESEHRFKHIVELAPIPVVITSETDATVLFYNTAAAQLFGVGSDAPESIHATEFYKQPELRPELLARLEDGHAIVGEELEVISSSGDMFWISLSMNRITFEGKAALFSAFVDITGQKHVERTLEEQVSKRTAELREARDELKSTLNNMLDTYYRISAEGRVVWASQSVQPLLGYSSAEIAGMSVVQLLAGDIDYADAVEGVRAAGGTLMNHRVQLKHCDGNLIWASISAHLIFDAEGEISGMEGVIRDITRMIQAEEQKQEMEKKMAHVQRLESLGVLAGGIAHDFNNILAGIMGNAELAEMGLAEKQPVDMELKNIVTSSIRAADLCKQMLAYSGQGSLVRKAVNLSALVEETVQLIDVSISKNVTLAFDLQTPMPVMMADITQMQQVIMNLITNASEAIGEEKVGEIHVTTGVLQAGRKELDSRFLVEKRSEGEYLFLEVRDNGCGMDEQTVNKIFDPFFTTKFTGRGLGMSATLGIVRSHAGSIQVHSQAGKGSTFRVLFPAYQGDDADTDVDHLMPELPAVTESRGTVLVIDDEVMVRAIVEKMLKRMGFDVLLAGNGREGLAVFQENQNDIDAVLLDMTMPEMGGKETLIQLKGMDSALPVVVCSGFRDESVNEKFGEIRPSAFLQKPFSMKSLHEVMEQSLSKSD